MTPYDFEVLKDGVVIDIQSIHLPHIRFAWPEIVRLAKRFRGPGHKIRVKEGGSHFRMSTLSGTNSVQVGSYPAASKSLRILVGRSGPATRLLRVKGRRQFSRRLFAPGHGEVALALFVVL